MSELGEDAVSVEELACWLGLAVKDRRATSRAPAVSADRAQPHGPLVLIDVREEWELRVCDLRRHLEPSAAQAEASLRKHGAPRVERRVRFVDPQLEHGRGKPSSTSQTAPQPGQVQEEEEQAPDTKATSTKWRPRLRGQTVELGYSTDGHQGSLGDQLIRPSGDTGTTAAEETSQASVDDDCIRCYFAHIPMGMLKQRIHELYPFMQAEVVVMCHLGQRSHIVTQYLRSTGFKRARNLEGGLAAWTARIDPHLPSY